MGISNVLERSKLFLFTIVAALVLAVIFVPTMFVHATSIGTNVTVTGTTTLSGNVTIGDSATADTLTVTARLAADLDPNANGTIDLGAFDLAYDNIVASGTAYLAGLTVGVDGTFTVGTSTANTLTVTARLAADLDPNANNTIDLGSYGLAFNDVFASGTLHMATSSLVNTFGTSTLFVSSTVAGYGSRIIMSNAQGTGCVALYFNATTGLTSSTVTCLDN